MALEDTLPIYRTINIKFYKVNITSYMSFYNCRQFRLTIKIYTNNISTKRTQKDSEKTIKVVFLQVFLILFILDT